MSTPGPPLDEDRIVEVFARHGVEYVLVGGLGARAHGATRPTGDFDAVAAWDRENLSRAAAALNELGARLRDAPAELRFPPIDATTLHQQLIGTWRTTAGDLDVIIGIPSGTPRGEHQYETLRSRATARDLAGCTVYVADLGDIIASKEAADRPKDREALPELRALRAAQLAGAADPEAARIAELVAESFPEGIDAVLNRPPSPGNSRRGGRDVYDYRREPPDRSR